jgi:hypothetical protein
MNSMPLGDRALAVGQSALPSRFRAIAILLATAKD